MKSLLNNEVNQVGGSRMSVNPCYKYVDCSYIQGVLATGSSNRCPADMNNSGANYIKLDTAKDRELTEVTYLVNLCS